MLEFNDYKRKGNKILNVKLHQDPSNLMEPIKENIDPTYYRPNSGNKWSL